jgi:hypothetical protein
MNTENLKMLITVGMESMNIPQIVDAYTEAANLIQRCEKYEAALIEISKGEGRYDEDRLQHASNTIQDMIALAKEALKDGPPSTIACAKESSPQGLS